MCKRLLVASFFLAFSALVHGQDRANFPWWNSPVRADLHLTDAQTEKIRSIVRSYRDRLLDARNNTTKAQQDLEDLLNDPNVSLEQAKPVIDRVAAARANSSRVFLQMSVQLRSVLTLDQWRILVRRWDEVRSKKIPDTQVPP